MKKLNLTKTLLSGLALSLAIFSQVWAYNTCPDNYDTTGGKCIKTGSCGTNCVYEHDYGTKTLTYSVADTTKNGGKASITTKMSSYGLVGARDSIIVEEGIESINARDAVDVGANSKITLPTSLTSISQYGIATNGGTIEINSNVHNLTSYSIKMGSGSTLLIPAYPDLVVADNFSFDGWPKIGQVNIICKGNVSVCESTFGGKFSWFNSKGGQASISNILYDADGKKLQEWSNDGSSVKYNSQGYISAKYNANGNLLESYTYDGAGNITAKYDANGVAIYTKTLYTPAEAAAAANRGNNNTVTITFK